MFNWTNLTINSDVDQDTKMHEKFLTYLYIISKYIPIKIWKGDKNSTVHTSEYLSKSNSTA